MFARTALGAAVLLPLAIRAGRLDTVRRHWRPLLAFTAIENLGPWALLSDAENRLTSSMTGLLIAAVPIIGVVLARLTGDAERLGPVRWAGLLVGPAGVGVLAGPHLSGGSAWAIGEVMLVALGYSIAPIIATRRLQDLPSLHMAAFALAIAALVYTGPAIATWPASMPSGRVLAALIGLGLVWTALAFIVFFELIREVGTSRGMVFTYVNPAVAVAAGVLFLGEPLTGTIMASFALILGGSVLATARRAPASAPAAPAADDAATDSETARTCERTRLVSAMYRSRPQIISWPRCGYVGPRRPGEHRPPIPARRREMAADSVDGIYLAGGCRRAPAGDRGRRRRQGARLSGASR